MYPARFVARIPSNAMFIEVLRLQGAFCYPAKTDPKLSLKAPGNPDDIKKLGLRSLLSGSRRQNIFNLCESFVSFGPPHHNMTEISD
jgi:hypothetical protein